MTEKGRFRPFAVAGDRQREGLIPPEADIEHAAVTDNDVIY